MNMNVALNSKQLKQRIDAFFALREEHKEARVLMNTLADAHQAWIFGGMLRDISLFGSEGFTSDIDIVVNTSREELIETLTNMREIDFHYNKFGGLRFCYQNMDFDVWSLTDTWAFKENLIPFENASSLLKTTLMSWDSVLYDLHTETLIYSENYLDDLSHRHLELVLDHNPNPSGSVSRILRTVFTKQVKSLGPQLCCFLMKELSEISFDILQDYEIRHYNHSSFSRKQINQLSGSLQRHKPGKEFILKNEFFT